MGFILWHARHELLHILLGLIWAWILREWWNELNIRWILIAILGSLLPDAEHLIYFFSYGKKDEYTHLVKEIFKAREWRMLTTFLEQGHKHTNLTYHNIYFVALLLLTAVISLAFDRKSFVVLFGAMIIHYVFDILDDYKTLGYLNDNWKRWGRNKTHRS